MRNIALVLFCLTGVATFGQAPGFSWASTFGASNQDGAQDVATDASGNVYVTGYFFGTMDADPGPGVTNLVSNGQSDAYISKFDPAGNLLWSFSYGAGYGDVGYGIAVSPAGNVYVTGYFCKLVDFDPSSGVDTLRNADDPCNTETYILKVDANGNHVWVKRIAGIITWCTAATDIGQDIAIDAQENVYVTGQFQGTADFNTSEIPADTFKLTVNGSALDTDFFVLKLNSSGEFIWVRRAACQQPDAGYGIHVNEVSGVFVTGLFGYRADFDPGSGTDTIQYKGNWDMFLLNLDKDGNYRWAHGFGTSFDDRSYGVTSDPDGNVYFTGMFWGSMDIDPGTATQTIGGSGDYNIMIARFDTLGNLDWANCLKGSSAGYYRRGNGMCSDGAGGIYITGEFSDSMDFHPGNGPGDTLWLKSNGPSTTNDVFIQRYTLSGNMDWTARVGGAGNDIGSGITVDASGNIITCGRFGMTIDFDPGPGIYSRTSAGNTDAFILKLIPAATEMNTDEMSSPWKVWPNPGHGLFHIEGPDLAGTRVYVFDISGHEVAHIGQLNQYGSIDIANLPAGWYLLKVLSSEAEVFSARIMLLPE